MLRPPAHALFPYTTLFRSALRTQGLTSLAPKRIFKLLPFSEAKRVYRRVAARDDYLIDQLIELGYVTHQQVDALRSEADAAGGGVVDLLVDRKIITANDVANAKAAHFGVEVVNLSELKLDDSVIATVPRHIAKRYRCIPVYRHGNTIGIAIADPSDLDTIDSLHHLLNAELEIKIASEDGIEAALTKLYGVADDDVGKMIQDITEGEVEVAPLAGGAEIDDGGTVDADAPIIKLVN